VLWAGSGNVAGLNYRAEEARLHSGAMLDHSQVVSPLVAASENTLFS
jgi:hypothetical protein